MRLLILEDMPAARAVAKAYGSELNPQKGNIARITMSGKQTVIYWHERMRLLGSGKKPALSEKAEALLAKLIESETIDEIITALYPTRTSALFTDCLRRRFEDKGVSVYSVLLTTLRKKDILFAFENAKKSAPDGIEAIRATSERHNAYTLTNAIWKLIPPEGSLRFDINLLTALYLIGDRSQKEREPKYRIRTSIEIDAKNYEAYSADEYTHEEASALIPDLGKKLYSAGVSVLPLPTVTSLYGVYKNCEFSELRLRDTALSLYAKRYISCPFTLCGSLPAGMTNNAKGAVISACRAAYPDENRLDIDALSDFDALSAIGPSAILPLKDTLGSLSDSEKLLYSEIVSAAKNTICSDALYSIPLYDKKTGVRFSMPLPESMPRGVRSFTPGPLTLEADGQFKSFTLPELMQTLVSMGLDSSDVIISLADRLIKTGTVRSDNFGLHLTGKGQQILQSLPIEPAKLFELFTTLNSHAQTSAEINTHLVEIANLSNRTAAEWISLAENKTPADDTSEAAEVSADKDTEAAPQQSSQKEVSSPAPSLDQPSVPESPDPAASGPDHKEVREDIPVPSDPAASTCPFCGEKALHELENEYKCSSCGNAIGKVLRIEDAFYTINEKDIFNLTAFRRTKLKRGKDASGEIISGGYIMIGEDGLAFSHRSNYKCPYCGQHMNAYAWGFSCSSCSFGVPFEVYHVKLKGSDVKLLLSGSKTSVINDLISPQGEFFSAKLLALPDGKIRPYIVKNKE